MDRKTEIALLEELWGLKTAGSAYLDPDISHADVSDYTDPARFAAEHARLFRSRPIAAAHASELPEPGAFLTRDLFGSPTLLTRDKAGEVHAFLNVCRHRGARLVAEDAGCKHSFSCPYHAWTYTNTGALRGIPHQSQGFPGIDKSTHGLVPLICAERYGLIWVISDPHTTDDIDAWLAPIAADLDWVGMHAMRVQHVDILTLRANWKLLIEGGIEAYHFKVAHKDTIAPYFEDNLSSYTVLGPHMRSVLPRATLGSLRDRPVEEWDIRQDANLLYTVSPTSQFLVQQDHVAWISLWPVSAAETHLRLVTVAPDTSPVAKDAARHWRQNHAITCRTLSEDFEIGVGIQDGLTSGANRHLTFGRYEGALAAFARIVTRQISD
ncbi:SRPBCC family protein [Aestuariivita sp.]|jgi:phenylpropionate dioxygenase-like ring-hydroxylating dioxygenase large terminal subunit|uniref:aromatic ring-hydroxylating oxygenase subunit alpha n=1 Tax=Aestuariivita sp. TaxID=1872407 RepID=UPI0021728235|nr:SRPBCC family protein [Aestuariivita sp.]MCE8006279.1 Rieske 2Fe-2S domain-containing protein [Aestuariivita sp.]